MNVLIACEESQRVCTAFRERGHTAWSCDILPCSGGHPEWHILGDCLPLLNGNCEFTTEAGGRHEQKDRWDLIIAHPPCTYLSACGNRWFDVSKYGDNAVKRQRNRYAAIVFFMQMITADCQRIAVENPVGIMSTAYRKPDQIIHPYNFGDSAEKKTCLWLKNLPPLFSTQIVDAGEKNRFGQSINATAAWAKDERGKAIPWNDKRTAIIRSKTFPGIARAMAEQWGTDSGTYQIAMEV